MKRTTHKNYQMETKKKILKICIVIILLCILILGVFALPQRSKITMQTAKAAESTDTTSQQSEADEGTNEELNSAILEELEKLDLEALQNYVDSLDGFSNKSVVERLLDFINDGGVNYQDFWKQLSVVFFKKVSEILPCFACIAAISLLSGLISMLKSGANANTASEMIFLVTYAAALIPLIGVLTECFTKTTESVLEMKKQMQITYPLILTLMSASGGSLTAAVCRPAVVFFSSTIVSALSDIVFPLTVTITVFSMASNLTKELKINRFTAFFKSINKWIIGVCVSVFGLFFTLQGITAATYDGVVRRAAKYAIGNGVPIVGGFLSGGFDLAVAGSVLIKNSLGSMGIFLMFAVLFEPLILLIATNILLRLTAAVTQPFGDGRISDFLGETADNLHYCTAGLLFTAFLYFLTILLMVYSSEALF